MIPSDVVLTAVLVGGCARRAVLNTLVNRVPCLRWLCRVEKSVITQSTFVVLRYGFDYCCVTPCSTALVILLYGSIIVDDRTFDSVVLFFGAGFYLGHSMDGMSCRWTWTLLK